MKVFLRGLAGVVALALLGSLLFRTPAGSEAAKRSAGGRPLVAFALATGGPPPRADAGFDRSVAAGATAVLDASGSSDPEGDELSFSWTLESKPIGSLTLISDPAAIKPSFQADEPGDTVARLTATFGNSATRLAATGLSST